MTRQAFQLRQDTDQAYGDFDTVLTKVTSEAGLTRAQPLDLEAAFNAAQNDLAKAAFVAGLLAGRDPLSLFLEPAAAGDQAGEGGDHARR